MSAQDVSDAICEFFASKGFENVRVPCTDAGSGVVLIRGFSPIVRSHTSTLQGVEYVSVAIQPLLNKFQRLGWTANTQGPDHDDLIVRTE
jgi:hypothetical protein